MVSQDSPPNPSSSIFHQFIISDSISAQNHHLETHHLDAYPPSFQTSTAVPQALGVLPGIHSLGERMSRSVDLVQAPTGASVENQAQRLSLSLGSRMLVPSVQYRYNNFLIGEESGGACNPGVEHVGDEYCFMGGALASHSRALNRSCSTSYGAESVAAVIANSKYLKPAQSLLDEIVNVGGKLVDISNEKHVGKLYGEGRRGGMGLSSELKAELSCNAGLMNADKHELQARLANLITLLEQVEDRCGKYYHQMEQVISSFEMVVGEGAAKSYTALALKAMSRHFCSLRDAIVSHIYTEKRKLLQDVPKISSGLSQLNLFDKECRQKRMSLQQLGIFQSQRQAFRPIRGLPETSVAILRTWLFEHFLHPYPNDNEKLLLASQTGLSKNQVANWFINARVRLWKPMIEEMYKEEFGESSEDSNSLAAGSMTGEGNTDQTED
ncbi:BEL1-like homeodomain protein 11 [Pyrus x bretschneideri]|uniref:BEL1-like homeodomain protein 11 n=1 Tax=Pyrus x bretschneideri TaxID=225117 RepID=UPI00202F1123|nr:BEL1-like homeodomain protein 11 [Pyrus x bretschneideri]